MSCCTCGNNCQSGYGCLYQVVLPDNPVSLYSAANINTQGIGVYDSTEGTEFDFRGIVSGNSSIVVTLDAGTNSIVLTLNVDQIIDDLPQATTTQRGVGETATDAEAIGKASTTVFLTPSNLAAIPASTTFAGLVELATNAETQAGVSVTLAVTPAGLASVLSSSTFGVQTFADAVARAAAVPVFEGQYGYQLNTNIPYVADGLAVGDWQAMPALENTNNALSAGSNTAFDLALNTSLSFNLTGVGSQMVITGNGTLFLGCTVDFEGTAEVGGIGIINSLIGVEGSGIFEAYPLNTFAYLGNVNTGWTGFTNSAVRKTGDCNTITLPQLAQVVDTLINMLKVPQLPAT